MDVIAETSIRGWARDHPDAAAGLLQWLGRAKAARWTCMDDVVRTMSGDPDPVSDQRLVFDIHGKRYRLVAQLDFTRGPVFLKWFGTHAEYDDIDPAKVPLTRPRSKP